MISQYDSKTYCMEIQNSAHLVPVSSQSAVMSPAFTVLVYVLPSLSIATLQLTLHQDVSLSITPTLAFSSSPHTEPKDAVPRPLKSTLTTSRTRWAWQMTHDRITAVDSILSFCTAKSLVEMQQENLSKSYLVHLPFFLRATETGLMTMQFRNWVIYNVDSCFSYIVWGHQNTSKYLFNSQLKMHFHNVTYFCTWSLKRKQYIKNYFSGITCTDDSMTIDHEYELSN